MSSNLLFNEIKELSSRLEASYIEQARLTSELGDMLDEALVGKKCPACGATSRDDTLFAYDYHKGSFAIACNRCGFCTPHTASIEVAINFLDAIPVVVAVDKDTIRTKDGYKIDDDF